MTLDEGEWVGCDTGHTAPGGGIVGFGLGRFAKRAFDIVVATLGIVLFAPILLVTSIAIKLDSPGPILFRQTLFGYGRRAVRVYRFRFATRCQETQSVTPRLTRVGRIMHQTGIGGLPQLFSVLFGEMSIVGPRPYVEEQDFSGFPQATLLRSVKPGIIDWASPADFRTDRTARQRRSISCQTVVALQRHQDHFDGFAHRKTYRPGDLTSASESREGAEGIAGGGS